MKYLSLLLALGLLGFAQAQEVSDETEVQFIWSWQIYSHC